MNEQANDELPFWFTQRVEARFEFLYGKERTPRLMDQLLTILQAFSDQFEQLKEEHWDERDVNLITYGDNIRQENEKPLQTLNHFLNMNLKDCFNSLHSIPYFP